MVETIHLTSDLLFKLMGLADKGHEQPFLRVNLDDMFSSHFKTLL